MYIQTISLKVFITNLLTFYKQIFPVPLFFSYCITLFQRVWPWKVREEDWWAAVAEVVQWRRWRTAARSAAGLAESAQVAASASPSATCSKPWTSTGMKTVSSAAAAIAGSARSAVHSTLRLILYFVKGIILGEGKFEK